MELNPFEGKESNNLFIGNNVDFGLNVDYIDLAKSISDEVMWKVEAGFTCYQGDFLFLGNDKEENIYFLTAGHGSCSGCDALQGCQSKDELIELRDELKRGIRKFNSLAEFKEWFNNEAQTEWYSKSDVTDFIEKVKLIYAIELRWRE